MPSQDMIIGTYYLTQTPDPPVLSEPVMVSMVVFFSIVCC